MQRMQDLDSVSSLSVHDFLHFVIVRAPKSILLGVRQLQGLLRCSVELELAHRG